MELADKLISLRKQKNWTQATAAREIDIQQSYLSKLENGRHLPSLDVIDKLCSAYNIRSKDLLSSKPKRTKQNIGLIIILTFSVSLILSGYLALFFPQTYYTYKVVPIQTSQKQNLVLKIQLTDQYLGERYFTNITEYEYEYELIAQREVSRIENRWLIAIGAVIFLLTFVLIFYKLISENRSNSNLP